MEHSKFIDLEDTNFSMVEIVHDLPTTMAFFKKQPANMADFGTVFVGWDKLQTDAQRERALEVSTSPGAPIFTIPETWRFPQLLRALGAFQSASQAMKNGWNKDIEPNITEVVFRIKKRRGSLWIHKISDIDLEV